jgi:nickel-dependent lactate racemase
MHKKIQIPYDHSHIDITIPEKNIVYLSTPWDQQQIKPVTWKNDLALNHMVGDKKVLILLADATRDIPFHTIIDHLFLSLGKAPRAVTLCLATGTHDGDNDENDAILSYARNCADIHGIPLTATLIHNCHTHPCFNVGKTSFGNDILVNEIVHEHDFILIHADMKHHYFAGYSNPIKYIIPGICAYQTIERNHALALDARSTFGHHPLHPDANRRCNPVSQDMWEGFQLVTKNIPVYVILTISMARNIVWQKSGLLTDVVPQGMHAVDEKMGLRIPPSDKLIVSCGGYPNDESLYTAQRALELTKNAIRDGGDILFIAGCRNGIGPAKSIENFYHPLKGDLPALLRKYAHTYKMYTHKVYKFAQLINRINKLYFYSMLPDEKISIIHSHPVTNIQDVVDRWLDRENHCKINIFLNGNKIAVYA